MANKSNKGPFSTLKNDLPASLVVFFVALPLCLGIALASGAPLLSGVIAGIVGGIVGGMLSGSALGVSGPAAGLAVIVLGAINELGFETFLVAGVLAGLMQIVFGLIKAGKVARIFPSSVISGMLAGIGIIIFLKQIPHLMGYNADMEGDFSFFQADGETTFSELSKALEYFNGGAIIIAVVSLAILLFWQTPRIKGNKILSLIPGPLIVVVVGIGLAKWFDFNTVQDLTTNQFVSIPEMNGWEGIKSELSFPDWTQISSGRVWFIAVTIALVASVETLLCVEATDKLDPYYKKVTPTNRELLAQGTSNVLSCLIGGIPITQVIVRSSANIQAGGRSKVSAIMHGFWLIVAVLVLPSVLNTIPIASLAAVLTIVGYKLAQPSVFMNLYKQGAVQFFPFFGTVIVMLFTGLLEGVAVGFGIATIFILYNSYHANVEVVKSVEGEKKHVKIYMTNNVTFLSKIKLSSELEKVENKTVLTIDISKADKLHPDIVGIMDDYEVTALRNHVRFRVVGKEEEPAPVAGSDKEATQPA